MRLMNTKLLKTREVARLCNVHPRTVARWLRDGSLKGIKINAHTWRVRSEDLEEFLEGQIESPD